MSFPQQEFTFRNIPSYPQPPGTRETISSPQQSFSFRPNASQSLPSDRSDTVSFPQQEFTFQFASPRPSLARERENDELCGECAKLDLEESFARAYTLYEGARRGKNPRTLSVWRSPTGPPYLGHFYYVASLGNRLSSIRRCKLCKFLSQMTADPSQGPFKLVAFCSSESYLFDPPKKDARGRREWRPWGEVDHNVFMGVVPVVPLIPKTGIPLRWLETELPKCGSIYRLTREEEEARLAEPQALRPKADLDLASTWLSYCRDTHACCAFKKPTGASLPGFRAINCTKSPPVVEDQPWSQSYVALSYVWGPASGDWPQTILDAVEVTKSLGEKYLWVDRLCIDQTNLQEQQFLISRMDAIYEGAEFTIVAAAGDARTGLPGVTTTPRVPQPQVELKKRRRNPGSTLATRFPAPAPDAQFELFGITKEDYEETAQDREWLDLHRFGLEFGMKLDMSLLLEDERIMKKYSISSEHLDFFLDAAEDSNQTIEEHMAKMKQLSQKLGIPLKELVPHLLHKAGLPVDDVKDIAIAPKPIIDPLKMDKPLPPGKFAGRTTLISTLEEPRITIKNSGWATRGWTYQEGVLSNRRLVFTEQQIYWECRAMTMNESLETLNFHNRTGTRNADFMLSGIFDGDLHRGPELQYGFPSPTADTVSEQIQKLDSHIRAFTGRNLSYASDSLNAFLGVAARYSTDDGLCLLLGMPAWAGLFADGKPGLQHTFALSLSLWTHPAQRVTEDGEMYVANCPRRAQFPSWTWAGWEGRVDFNATTNEDESEGDEASDWDGPLHVDFFNAMTDKSWVSMIKRLWSAEMLLHAADGSEAIPLAGGLSVANAIDPSRTWLLTIREPLVLRHMHLMHSRVEGEWRRLMDRRVQIHLSVPMTEADLTAGYRSGELVTLLVYASTVPFVYTGTARYLILRRADAAGTRWERIGRLIMAFEEWDMDKFESTAGMIATLPVKKFERYITLV